MGARPILWGVPEFWEKTTQSGCDTKNPHAIFRRMNTTNPVFNPTIYTKPPMTEEQKLFLEGMFKNRCHIQKACAFAGITRFEYISWVDEYDPDHCVDFIRALANVRANMVDDIEDVVLKAILKKGDTRLAVRWLEANAPDRGWGKTPIDVDTLTEDTDVLRQIAGLLPE